MAATKGTRGKASSQAQATPRKASARPGPSTPDPTAEFDLLPPLLPTDDGQPGVLITFAPSDPQETVATLNSFTRAAGLTNMASASDYRSGALDLADAANSDVILFDELGVAVASVDPDRMVGVLRAAADEARVHVEPEPIFFAIGAPLTPDQLAYVRGYRDATNHLADQLLGGRSDANGSLTAAAIEFRDTDAHTWGLAATRVLDSTRTGRGVKLAVLDTGIDLNHPDFAFRAITTESFIPGQDVQDGNGHGTHCAGTAAGTRTPGVGPRYGIASDADLFVGKVLSDQGSARGRSTLAGIEWALRNDCQVISMSLGSPIGVGEGHSVAFEQIGRAALARNALIVAAAGNESDRRAGIIAPVGSPANCPSIMAVAAVDRFLQVADFSCGAINPDALVDISGPGVDILSSTPDPAPPPQPPDYYRWRGRTDRVSGTSQATPHVAGIAALLREAQPAFSATDLWQRLVSGARKLPLPARDVGAGLVQA